MDFIDISLYIAYALTLLAGIAAIVFPIIHLAGDPKSFIKAGSSKFIGGCLITMYVALFAAVGGILYTEITKALK